MTVHLYIPFKLNEIRIVKLSKFDLNYSYETCLAVLYFRLICCRPQEYKHHVPQ